MENKEMNYKQTLKDIIDAKNHIINFQKDILKIYTTMEYWNTKIKYLEERLKECE